MCHSQRDSVLGSNWKLLKATNLSRCVQVILEKTQVTPFKAQHYILQLLCST